MRRICFRLNVGSRSDLLLELSEKLRAHPQQRVQNRKYTGRNRAIDDCHQVASSLSILSQVLEFRDHFCNGFRNIRKSGSYWRWLVWSGRQQAKNSETNLPLAFVNRA